MCVCVHFYSGIPKGKARECLRKPSKTLPRNLCLAGHDLCSSICVGNGSAHGECDMTSRVCFCYDC